MNFKKNSKIKKRYFKIKKVRLFLLGNFNKTAEKTITPMSTLIKIINK